MFDFNNKIYMSSGFEIMLSSPNSNCTKCKKKIQGVEEMLFAKDSSDYWRFEKEKKNLVTMCYIKAYVISYN